ncbi:MAG: DUF2064 domain-containing protein, partial [Variovorax sp.]|nr:DUF2064 domain-containing protein [Variovorax sp.]
MAQPPRIVIFAKAPVAGLAKTRLIPALGAQGAARLAAALLRHAVAQALASAAGPVELCVTPAPRDPVWSGLMPQAQLSWSDQGDGDLGERMARASQRALAQGACRALVVDSENRPQRGHFLPDSPPHGCSMGQ